MDSIKLETQNPALRRGSQSSAVKPETGPRAVRNLVLCFDGTSNEFKGDGTDTNILKIFSMLDKSVPEQYHYYQPGIGTYVINDSLARTDKMAAFRAKGAMLADLIAGTSVSEHVLGGYRFLMRYWGPEDRIYIFGFSRGAYTARFLAEMLDHVGLLPHGNEEMVGFAWKTFSEWQMRKWSQPKEISNFWKTMYKPYEAPPRAHDAETAAAAEKTEGAAEAGKKPGDKNGVVATDTKLDAPKESYRFFNYLTLKPRRDRRTKEKSDSMEMRMRGFKVMFSRDIKAIHFLGLFDTVSSVPQFDVSWMTRGGRFAYTPRSKANEIWHAVSVDERRVCFRASLMYQTPDVDDDAHYNPNQKVSEAWFPGNHGDVGGGWAPIGEEVNPSYIPLVWMVRAAKRAGLHFVQKELDREKIVLEQEPGAAPISALSPIAIRALTVPKGKEINGHHAHNPHEHGGALRGTLHDCLRGGPGQGVGMTVIWFIAQRLPIKIMESINGQWKPTRFGRKPYRNIPHHPKTRLHASVVERRALADAKSKYDPKNLPGPKITKDRKWWQHGPLGFKDDTGFEPSHWEIDHDATPPGKELDFFSRVYKLTDDALREGQKSE